MDQTACSGCGRTFGCGVKEPGCWCASLPRVMPVAGERCLCPECLEAALRRS